MRIARGLSRSCVAVVALLLATTSAPATAAVRSSTEVKVRVHPGDLVKVRQALGFGQTPTKRQQVHFFDRTGAPLFDKGTILRIRRTEDASEPTGHKAKLTVKLRPASAARLAKAWRHVPGFKHELDVVGGQGIPTASISIDVKDGKAQEVLAGKRTIRSLITPAQLELIAQVRPSARLARARATPPIAARVWEGPSPIGDVTLEHWRLGGATFVELSAGATGKGRKVERALQRWLAAEGIRLAPPGTKTSAAFAMLGP